MYGKAVVVVIAMAVLTSGCSSFRLAPLASIRQDPQRLIGREIRTTDGAGQKVTLVRWVRYPNVGGSDQAQQVDLRTATAIEIKQIDVGKTIGVTILIGAGAAFVGFLAVLAAVGGIS